MIRTARILFNDNWRFFPGDRPDAAREDFSDRDWEPVRLPHDWVISRPYTRGGGEGEVVPDGGEWNSDNMQGFFDWKGIGWYRKTWELPELDNRRVLIYFGGAYRNSTVYVNGRKAGGRANGYLSFELDITTFVHAGTNTLAVRLDNSPEPPDRWYAGAGLYRNVYLTLAAPLRVDTWGVRVRTEPGGEGGVAASAAVIVETALVNDGAGTVPGQLHLTVIDPKGLSVAETRTSFTAPVGGLSLSQRLTLDKPYLWSAENPNIYRARLTIEPPETDGSTVETVFGIRDIRIAAGTGMTVNGKPVKLKGVSLHHEAGITGAAWFEAVWRRRLEILKSIGCNAIRTSHNPPAEELLDLCDELGFYVVDECFDKWKSGSYAAYFDADWQRDLTGFVRRDRHHPSIFLWSVGNEVENQGEPSMLAIQKLLCDTVRALDGRPVTCALEPHVHPASLITAPEAELVARTAALARDVDVLGLNYHEPLFAAYSAAIEKPILGTECYEYYSQAALNYEDVTTKNPWRFVVENDNVIGQFIWAGFDYLGESGWPAKGWAGAILDICGFPKPNAFFRRSIWTDEPMIYLALHDDGKKPDYTRGRWSFPPLTSHLNIDRFRRRMVRAALFTNCDEAELVINGKVMGRRVRQGFENGIIEWSFEYAEGEIEARGLQNGKVAARYLMRTAAPPAAVRLRVENPRTSPASTVDIIHVIAEITGTDGAWCPHAENLIEFTVSPPTALLGAASGDICAPLGFTGSRVYAHEGRALVLVRPSGGGLPIKLTASSGGLTGASIDL